MEASNLVLHLLILQLLLATSLVLSRDDQGKWDPIVRLTEVGYPDALCLDGSSAAFYFRPASSSSSHPRPSTKWLWYYEGGGWCTNPASCYYRSMTPLGSSQNYTTNFHDDPDNWAGGMFSADCTQNPLLCQFNLVYIKYCDGNSFAGKRDEPYMYNRTSLGKETGSVPLFFQGAVIRDAVMDLLLTKNSSHYNLAAATEVVVSGCSAGALAAYLHSDIMQSTIHSYQQQQQQQQQMMMKKKGSEEERQHQEAGPLAKFSCAPSSGFFLDHTNVAYTNMYQTQMKTIFTLSNASAGLQHSPCIQGMQAVLRTMATSNSSSSSGGEEQFQLWRCNFAEYSLGFSSVPTFILNSKTDMAQIPLQFLSELNGTLVPPYNKCTFKFPFPFKECFNNSIALIQPLLGFESSFTTKVFGLAGLGGGGSSTNSGRRMKNGYFINSCWTHCESQLEQNWNGIHIGGISMRKAFENWYSDVVLQQKNRIGGDSSRSSDVEKEVCGTTGGQFQQGNSACFSADHKYMDCSWTAEAPYACNPTCPPLP